MTLFDGSFLAHKGTLEADPSASHLFRVAVILVRLLGAAFFLTTALYCLASYSSFAYYQFLRPGLITWPATFVVIHHWLYWLWLVLVAGTLLPFLRVPRHRWWIAAYLAGTSVVGVWLLGHPVLAMVGNTARSLAMAMAALVFPLSLALLDHRLTRARLASQPADRRMLATTLVATVTITLVFGAAAAYRSSLSPSLGLSWTALTLGMAWSAALHALMLSVAFALVWASGRLAALLPRSGEVQYVALTAGTTVASSLLLSRVVFAAVAFTGAEAAMTASVVALTITLLWSSIARWRISGSLAEWGAADAFAAPLVVRSAWAGGALALVVPVMAVVVPRAVEQFDWDFLVQKLSVLVVWALVWAVARRVMDAVTIGKAQTSPAIAALAIGVVLTVAAPSILPDSLRNRVDIALDRYAPVDPSFHLLAGLSHGTGGDAADFYGFLKANSTIAHVDVAPVDVDYVRAMGTPASRPPNIFLFVIDSLRRDYLSPYNPRVSFTPGIDAFARESIVFQRTFTRYGGTGLAVPSIWMGGMTLHKQYITPSTPMSTLDKLVTAAGYRRLMSVDPIAERMTTPSSALRPLDADRTVKDYRLCQTLSELRLVLGSMTPDEPVFAYSLPQDVHMTHWSQATVADRTSYLGFFAPVAQQVHHIDGCFGDFIADLKARGLYDRSIVILTSDHGDSLGEEGRWGHAYTLFPEVMRIPLIIHLPSTMARSVSVDRAAVSFSADISPTLHALLGYAPADLGPLYGAPIVTRGAALRDRRSDRFLLSSSYGAVYGMLENDARSLYIADAINGRDYAYDLSGGGLGTRVAITDSTRAEHWARIREQVSAIAAQYHFVR